MALPDRLKEEELAEHGFEIVEPGKAKHRQWNSYRYKCSSCGIWDMQRISGGATGDNLCRKCRKREAHRFPSI